MTHFSHFISKWSSPIFFRESLRIMRFSFMLKLFGMLLLVKNTFLMLLKGSKWYSKYTDIASGVTLILYFWENEILLTCCVIYNTG
jgi:hypothetical protein